MSLLVTSSVAGILGLLTCLLGGVAMMRRAKLQRPYGEDGEPTLRRAVRAHGNLVEYAPVFVVLLGLLEWRVGSSLGIVVLAAPFLIARAAYLGYFFGREALPLRVIGFMGTVWPIAISAGWLLASA